MREQIERAIPLSAGHANRAVDATAAPRVAELGGLAEARGFDVARYLGDRTIVLIADHWTDWVPLLRTGVTPKRALDLNVDGNRRSRPRGSLINGDGTIIMSS